MVRYREILRLRAMGVSRPSTALSCGCAPPAVQEAGKRERAAGAGWPLPEEMGGDAIRARACPPRPREASRHPVDHERAGAGPMGRGAAPALRRDEHRGDAVAHGAEPHRYSAFRRPRRRWPEERALSMRVGRRCAERTGAGWAGDPMGRVGPDTGGALKAWVSVACLPWSQHAFAEAFPDMGEESRVGAHVRAFALFGGTTPLPVPDDRRTGVPRNTPGELAPNGRHRRTAGRYGCAVVPAGPLRPRDKGSVEAAVGPAGRRAAAPLRDRAFPNMARDFWTRRGPSKEKPLSSPTSERKG